MNPRNLELVKENLSFQSQDVKALFRERITPETDLPPMQPLFEMFGSPCFYRGELVADCGKAKSGKTTFLSILMAGALKEQLLSLKRLSDVPLKVLWIDTEQSQQSTQEILKQRIMPLAEVETLDETQFYAFNLRGLGFEKREKMVELAINEIEPDICIIDGVKDLMTDINDAPQATRIMEKLMTQAKLHNCCIVCVLHQNKAEQDRNMRGSIGTELTNKAFEVFQCEMIGESDTFKVTQTFSRKKKMNRHLYYRLDETGQPVEVADYREQPRDAKGRWTSTQTHEDLQALFAKAFEGKNQRPFKEVMAVALRKCGVVDRNAFYTYLQQAEDLDIIEKQVHPETGETWIKLLDNALPF